MNLSVNALISTYGDWAKAGVMLKALSVKLMPLAQAKIYENGKLVLETLQGHIDKQDLDWVPLANSTIRKKDGEKIYIETGALRNGISIRKIKSSKDDITIFIGASPWKKHTPSGLKYSDLMMYLEYGTSKIPPRPLIQPTYDELENKLKDGWEEVILKAMGVK